MNRVGILATLQSRPGKEGEVEQFLQLALPLVDAETGTTVWFAKIGSATFEVSWTDGSGTLRKADSRSLLLIPKWQLRLSTKPPRNLRNPAKPLSTKPHRW
jgi:hypothetical protein